MVLRNISTVLFFIFFMGLQTAVAAEQENSVTWMEADAPPFFINKGKFKGQGYGDLVTDILKENLPEYSHTEVNANISRHHRSLEQGRQVCTVTLYKTAAREEIAYFSIPSFFTLPVVLVINKKRLADFGGDRTIRLDALLKAGKLTIGSSKGRSYGKYVDTVLDRYKGKKNIFVYEGTGLSENFFKMLSAGRLDALICAPEEALYLAKQLGLEDEIMTLTIEENQVGDASWLSYVACSKTEWGEKIIDKINLVLLGQRPTERYRATYETWLDESSLEDYRELYSKIFLQIPALKSPQSSKKK